MSAGARTSRLSRHDEQILLEAAVAAPSLHNTQPWRFAFVDGDGIHVLADPDRQLRAADPCGRAVHISCGAALLNLRLAAGHLGYTTRVQLLPDPDRPVLLATARLTPGHVSGWAHELYPAIPHRHTNRNPYAERPVAEPLLEELRQAASLSGARLQIVSEDHEWHRLSDLIHEAGRAEDLHPDLVAERARWIGADPEGGEGIPTDVLGGRPRDPDGMIRDLGRGLSIPGRKWATYERRPTLAVLETDSDRPIDWMRTGQALERVLLVATVRGLAYSFLNQPVDDPSLRWLVRDPRQGAGHAQMILRLGYDETGTAVAVAPRRAVDDVRILG